MSTKVKILFVDIDVGNLRTRLAVDREVRDITEKLWTGTARDSFEFILQRVSTPTDLQVVLLEHRPHILHLRGLNMLAELNSLASRDQSVKSFSQKDLIELFVPFRDIVRCVVIDGQLPFSQADIISGLIGCVITLPESVEDRVKIAFISSFYQALSFGRNIREAFELGRLQIKLEGLEERKTTQLFLGRGVDANNIYPAFLGPEGVTKESQSTITPDRFLKVFLCHSSGDKPSVRELYHRLLADGIDPWLDEEKLLAGQDWQLEIMKAVRASDVVIVCLSQTGISKAGFIQREIRYALDIADEQPEGTIFLIPLKLEECDPPERLRRLQWINYFEERGYGRLMLALKHRAGTLGIAVRRNEHI